MGGAILFGLLGALAGAQAGRGGVVSGLVLGLILGALAGWLCGGIAFSRHGAAAIGLTVGALAWPLISGLRATTDLNQRFQAQQDGRLALTKMRNDVETSCSAAVVKLNGATVSAGTAGDTVTLDDSCVTNGTQVTWCATSANGSAP